MTAMVFSSPQAGAWRAEAAGLFREPVFAAGGLVVGLLALPTAAALALDGRLFLGIDIWIKPLKFEIALAIYLLTLSAYARWLPSGLMARRWWRIYAVSVAAAVAGELMAIVGAAALGTASHFNPTPVGQAVYALMGVMAVHLTGASAVFAVMIARSDRAPADRALRLGLVAGLALTFVLTLVVAGTMSNLGGHFVGGAGTDAGGLAVMGWARDGGDLRVAHLFATHALHALPLVGYLAGRRMAPGRARAVTWAASAGYAAFTLATFAQALAGRPFLPMLG